MIHVFLFFDCMKKLFLLLYWVFISTLSLSAEEMTLLRIGEETVLKSEFSQYFKQVSHLHKGNAETYFQNFLHYKLKVADAMERGMDTLPDFKRQCESLQMNVLKKFFTDEEALENCYRLWTEEESKRLFLKEWIKIEVLTFRLPQHHTMAQDKEAFQVMRTLYEMQVQAGKENHLNQFITDARVICEDSGTEWTPVNNYVKEIIDAQMALSEGEVSAPFYSPVGIHVVRLVDRKSSAEKERGLSLVRSYMESLGTESPAVKKELLLDWMSGKVVLPEEVNLQLKQIHDGLLAVYWDKAFLLDRLSLDFRQLDEYFQAHRKRYRWEFPHFKGAVIHCNNKKIASKIKKRLKKVPISSWQQVLQKMAEENPEYQTSFECGLFQIGKNEYVDCLAFKCGSFTPLKDFPYTFIVGKRLKKGPEEVNDVLPQVETDYRMQKEKELFDGLSLHFRVEINQDVLKTVNSCGNN